MKQKIKIKKINKYYNNHKNKNQNNSKPKKSNNLNNKFKCKRMLKK